MTIVGCMQYFSIQLGSKWLEQTLENRSKIEMAQPYEDQIR
jgi:hypothetical protein